jgi:hypothetical protein
LVLRSDYLPPISRYNVRRVLPRPDRCALLVIDMQACFSGMATPILENVSAIIDRCRSEGIPTGLFEEPGLRFCAYPVERGTLSTPCLMHRGADRRVLRKAADGRGI